MKKHIHFYLSFFFIIIVLSSCGENSKVAKKEIFYVDEVNKKWLSTDIVGQSFTMKNDDGINNSFVKQTDNHEFGKGWSSFIGITTKITETEEYYQNYSNSMNYQFGYSTSLSSSWPPFGNVFSFTIDNNSISYDFKHKIVFDVNYQSEYKSLIMGEDGYEEDNVTIYSTVEFIENYSIAAKTFEEVMHITFKDFIKHNDFAVSEIFFAPKIGLIKFKLNNGLKYNRVF